MLSEIKQYDHKVREATLNEDGRVLIRQMAFKGKHKLADKWATDHYVVVSMPNKDVHVSKIESDYSITKTLHRTMLLPFSAIRGISEINTPPSHIEKPHARTRSNTTARQASVPCSDSEHSSDSEQYDISVPVQSYKNPNRRRSRNGSTHPHTSFQDHRLDSNLSVLSDTPSPHIISNEQDKSLSYPSTFKLVILIQPLLLIYLILLLNTILFL